MDTTIAQPPIQRGTARRLGLRFPDLKVTASHIPADALGYWSELSPMLVKLNDGTVRRVPFHPTMDTDSSSYLARLKDREFLRRLPETRNWMFA